jgi:hypothetical protein
MPYSCSTNAAIWNAALGYPNANGAPHAAMSIKSILEGSYS